MSDATPGPWKIADVEVVGGMGFHKIETVDHTIHPPWTPDQIASANAFQHAGIMHPFTCGGERCREDLIAKPDGWHCPKCEYQQGWAHDFMLDWAWLKADPFRRTKESFATEQPNGCEHSKEAIVIDLPLPPDCLHPNARPHWAAKAKATKACRELACVVGRTKRPKTPFAAAAFRVTFWLKRKRDYDGLLSFCKAYCDGLQDAGIVANDSDFRPDGIVRFSGLKQTGGKVGVRFEIWEESPAAERGRG